MHTCHLIFLCCVEQRSSFDLFYTKEFIWVWVAFILEFWLFRPVIFSHFTFWFNIYFCILQEQKFMIGLILMVPVYAVQSVSRQAAQLLLFFIPTFLHKKLPLCFLNLFTLHVIVVILRVRIWMPNI